MGKGTREELWKKAYRKEFGIDPDQDLIEHRAYVELWRSRWKAAYENGQPWAVNLAAGHDVAA